MTAIHAHRIEPLLGEWHMHDTFGLMHPAPILLRRVSIGNDKSASRQQYNGNC